MRRDINRWAGFSIIETLIAIGAILVLLAGANSWFSNYSTRAKINEALSVAETAKTAIMVTCAEHSSLVELTDSRVGHNFPPSPYVASVRLSGSCSLPNITVQTTNTGLRVHPTLSLTADFSTKSRNPEWTCVSDGLDVHLPEKCRG